MYRCITTVGCILALLFAYDTSVRSQVQDSSTPKELWPEVDVYVPLKEKVRLFFLFTITKSEETRKNTEGQFGADVDYTVNKRLILRAGYRYGFSLTEGDPFKEHRPIVEQTFRQPAALDDRRGTVGCEDVWHARFAEVMGRNRARHVSARVHVRDVEARGVPLEKL